MDPTLVLVSPDSQTRRKKIPCRQELLVLSLQKFYNTCENKENIITFLDFHELSFLKYMKLDFTQIPFLLHGKGKSENLLEYLANNTDNDILIVQFVQ